MADAKGKAARDEASGQPKTIEWRGLEFEGPAKLPGTIAFDLAEAQADESIGGLFKVLRGALGPDQMKQVREQLATDEVDLDDAFDVLFNELTTAVMKPYGQAPGE